MRPRRAKVLAAMPATADRRRFLRHAALAALPLAAVAPARAAVAPAPATPSARWLALSHTHTGERLEIAFADGTAYRPDALTRLDRFLRDHYTGEVGRMDPLLFDQMDRLAQRLGATRGFEIISGYRCPATNERLKRTRGGGVATRSLHMDGRAIDLRLPGVPLADLRDAALSLAAGGVGYYPREQFVHIDTGRVRRW